MGITRRMLVMACLMGLWVVPAPAQTPALKSVMREKLTHSQQLLDAMVTSQWRPLEDHALALKTLTTRPAWLVLQSPEYQKQTARFVQALDALATAARRRDLDETAAAYASMTTACVQCHRQVARMRLAGEAPGRRPAP